MAFNTPLRRISRFGLLLLVFTLSLFLAQAIILPIIILGFPDLESLFSDLGFYGLYPVENFITSELHGPIAQVVEWDPRCEDGYILLSPNGPSVTRPGPMILDAHGSLVWASEDFGTSANLQVQNFKGQDYLTFWAGKKGASDGRGQYYLLDSSYSIAHTVSAVGLEVQGDLHEFHITPEGTALITVYNVSNMLHSNLKSDILSPEPIVDSVFQEVDLETGDLLFEWKASDHHAPEGSLMSRPFFGLDHAAAFDFYHINSVDKDSAGNYLISSRHFHSITCISPSGETLWILGGADNEFLDLSDGQATNFKWQHDARWIVESEGILSLFDNGKSGPQHVDATHSRGLLLQLDVPNHTVRVLQEFTSPNNIFAASQGSMRVLPDAERVFIGWGSVAAYSEYTLDGELLCETHLGASWFQWFERVKSYRATKSAKWRGKPMTRPDVMIDDDRLYVSWNGATDVAYWELQVSYRDSGSASPNISSRAEDEESSMKETPHGQPDQDEEIFESVETIGKTRFEESFLLDPFQNQPFPIARYRVAAYDDDHNLLGHSEAVSHSQVALLDFSTFTLTSYTVSACVFIGLALGARLFVVLCRSTQPAYGLKMPIFCEGHPRSRFFFIGGLARFINSLRYGRRIPKVSV